MAQKTCGEAGVSLIQNERASRLWWHGRSPQTFMDLLRMNTAGYSVPLALPIVPLSVVTCFGSEWNVLAAGPGWIMVAFCTRNQMPSGKTVAFQLLPLFILYCIVFLLCIQIHWNGRWNGSGSVCSVNIAHHSVGLVLILMFCLVVSLVILCCVRCLWLNDA